jgi:NitT/TauT family transport system permease protein
MDVFKNVVVPGALPFIFTGLQIGMGIAWLSWSPRDHRGPAGLGCAILGLFPFHDQVVYHMFTLAFWAISAAQASGRSAAMMCGKPEGGVRK